jgi:RNase P subunit RPR2
MLNMMGDDTVCNDPLIIPASPRVASRTKRGSITTTWCRPCSTTDRCRSEHSALGSRPLSGGRPGTGAQLGDDARDEARDGG